MRRPPLRPTLALRITVSFALGALLVSSAVAVGAYVITARLTEQEQQRTAMRQAYVNASLARARLRDPQADLPTILGQLTSGSSTRAVIYSAGRWYSSSLLVSRDALPQQVREQALAGTPVRAWTRVDRSPQIVVGVPLPAVDSAFFQLFDVSPLERTLNTLRNVLVATAAAATAAGAGTGWWASRRLTAPLRAVSAAARRLAGGDFDVTLSEQRDVELADLVASFDSMVAALRSRLERDARFAGDVSHELRSPLTTLRTSLSVLQARREELSSRGRDALDLLAGELDRFERLVDDLLDISRADAADRLEDPEPVRIAQLVRTLVDPVPGCRLVIDPAVEDGVVLGDKRRLEQVVRNLLDNADRHADGVTAVVVRKDEDQVEVRVDDAGPGVPAEERELVFDRFTRGRRAGRRGSAGGTGLGLALVREHVRLHGGSAQVTDAPDGGARFTVRLPLRPS